MSLSLLVPEQKNRPTHEAELNLNDPPLWKQFFGESLKQSATAKAKKNRTKERQIKQQQILDHIVRIREQQDLPPFFAVISGPTIRPYRMEELSVLMGRVSPHHRDVQIHLGSDNTRISRVHACIVYDHTLGCYCVVNLSKNGIKIKQPPSDKEETTSVEVSTVGRGRPRKKPQEKISDTVKEGTFIEHMELHVPIPLPNPATLDIQGVLVYVTVYYVAPGKPSKFDTVHPPLEVKSALRRRSGLKSDSLDDSEMKGSGKRIGLTYAQMIQAALKGLGGAATQPDVSKYIEEQFADEISGKKTWRNSVSGVLSANAKFVQEPIIDSTGKKDRKSLWRLKGYAPEGGAVAVEKK